MIKYHLLRALQKGNLKKRLIKTQEFYCLYFINSVSAKANIASDMSLTYS